MEHLVEQAQAGNETAAAELVNQTYQRIFAFLRRLAGNEDDAADLTQKTFARAWTALASYTGKSSFSTWLHGVAHHVYLDWRRQGRPAELQSDEWWNSRPATDASPFEDAAERDLAYQLYALVDQLEEQVRPVVHLHYYQGLSLAETAEVLGLATSTVKYRLRQALGFLRSRTTQLKAS